MPDGSPRESTLPGGLHCRFVLNRPAALTSRTVRGNELGFEGDTGTKFAARVRVLPGEGGQLTEEKDALVLKGGTSATVLISGVSNYNRAEPALRTPTTGPPRPPAFSTRPRPSGGPPCGSARWTTTPAS